MITTNQKNSTKKIILLLVIVFSHIFPVIISAYYDKSRQILQGNLVKLNELRYWLWCFTWWSAWTSLLTVLWAFHELFTQKKSSYIKQLVSLMITETNLISGGVFCLGGFLMTIHTTTRTQTITYPLLGNVKTLYVWLFYNFFWHFLAPVLVFYYFWKYCQIDKLTKKKNIGLVINLFNPTIYFLYVNLRPLIKIINYAKSKPYNYPQDYPYAPFFWIVGKYANKHEESSKSLFYWSTWLKSLFWLSITIIIIYPLFSLLFYLLIVIKKRQKSKIITRIDLTKHYK